MGLINMGARYYDPTVGRFISADPYGHGGSMDLYSYANGDPVFYCDPDGRYASALLEKTRDLYNRYEGDIDRALDHVQTGLDLAGMAPVVGAAADMLNAGIHAARGNWVDAGMSLMGAVPVVGDGFSAGRLGMRAGDNIIQKAIRGGDTGNLGRAGKQSKLKELALDTNISSHDRGWIQQEINAIERGKRNNIRVPPGKNLAHRRGYEAKKGYGYEYSDLQDIVIHKIQHKHEGY